MTSGKRFKWKDLTLTKTGLWRQDGWVGTSPCSWRSEKNQRRGGTRVVQTQKWTNGAMYGTYGTRMHHGKKTSRWRQCDPKALLQTVASLSRIRFRKNLWNNNINQLGVDLASKSSPASVDVLDKQIRPTFQPAGLKGPTARYYTVIMLWVTCVKYIHTYVVVPGGPSGVKLHVEQSLLLGQVVIFGLFRARQSVPLRHDRTSLSDTNVQN